MEVKGFLLPSPFRPLKLQIKQPPPTKKASPSHGFVREVLSLVHENSINLQLKTSFHSSSSKKLKCQEPTPRVTVKISAIPEMNKRNIAAVADASMGSSYSRDFLVNKNIAAATDASMGSSYSRDFLVNKNIAAVADASMGSSYSRDFLVNNMSDNSCNKTILKSSQKETNPTSSMAKDFVKKTLSPKKVTFNLAKNTEENRTQKPSKSSCGKAENKRKTKHNKMKAGFDPYSRGIPFTVLKSTEDWIENRKSLANGTALLRTQVFNENSSATVASIWKSLRMEKGYSPKHYLPLYKIEEFKVLSPLSTPANHLQTSLADYERKRHSDECRLKTLLSVVSEAFERRNVGGNALINL